MSLVTPLLKRAVYPVLSTTGYFGATSRPGLAVITYHGVLPRGYRPIDSGFDGSLITRETFRQQLQLLKKKYNLITPDQMWAWSQNRFDLPPRAALLTCDDGFRNNLTEMLPILQEEELKCIFFVTGASLSDERTMLWHEDLLLLFLRAGTGEFSLNFEGIKIAGVLGAREQRRSLWWNAVRQLSQIDGVRRDRFLRAAYSYFGIEESLKFYRETYPETERHFCLMTREELRELAAAGMTIGAHTLSHSILAQMPSHLAWSEIADCKTRLETALGREVWALAYPYGDAGSVTPEIVAMAKQAGFAAAFMNLGGGLGVELARHALPRVHVNADMGMAEFEAHASGFYEALRHRLHRSPQPNLPSLQVLSGNSAQG